MKYPHWTVTATDNGWVTRLHANGNTILSSTRQGYSNRADALRAIEIANGANNWPGGEDEAWGTDAINRPIFVYYEKTKRPRLIPNESGSRCLAITCNEREPYSGGSKWWADYGCCSRDHVEDYYGPEVLQ